MMREFLSYQAEIEDDSLPALEQARQVLREWAGLTGQEKCWHHPLLLSRLCHILGVPIAEENPCLPPREEFERGCVRYQRLLYDKDRTPPEGAD